ncbi:MAG TPA: hypothetical protein VJV04_02970 [Nitrospiraceae bacterium]|nr:hypothetical protein [Nitrospiraceae bacterium]
MLRHHPGNGADVSGIQPQGEKTDDYDPEKVSVEPENHKRDCSVKESMNQVPFFAVVGDRSSFIPHAIMRIGAPAII